MIKRVVILTFLGTLMGSLALGAMGGSVGLAVGPSALGATKAAIPTQPLGSALYALQRQTDLKMLYVSALAKDKTSASVPAGVPALDALKQMLTGTGLSYKMLNDHMVEIRAGENSGK